MKVEKKKKGNQPEKSNAVLPKKIRIQSVPSFRSFFPLMASSSYKGFSHEKKNEKMGKRKRRMKKGEENQDKSCWRKEQSRIEIN